MKKQQRQKKNISVLLMIILIIYVNIVAVLFGFSLFSVATGKANIVINGFAVDSSGFVYIGHDKCIEVYSECNMIKRISVPTSRGYAFTIDGDKIILSDGDCTYLMNLNGETADKQPNARNNLVYSRHSFVDSSGDSFKLKNVLGRTAIVKNSSDVVYRISDRDLIAKLFFEISVISVLIIVFLIIFLFRRFKSRNQKV